MARVRRIRWAGEPAVELATPELRLVATTGRGPRVACLSRPGGENLFYWAPGKHRHGAWDLLGGHRFWLARPGADEAEETYAPDNAAVTVQLRADGFELIQPIIAAVQIVRSLVIRARGPAVELEHRVTNVGSMLWSGGIWGLTCSQPTATTTYVIPLSDGSTWDTASMTFFKQWGGTHRGAYDDPQFGFVGDSVHVRSLGAENKRAFRATPGIVALHDPARDVLFVKHAPWLPGRTYPMDSNLAVYTGEKSFMVEMETMSPLVTLKPGEAFSHVERWFVRAAPRAVPVAAALQSLVGSANPVPTPWPSTSGSTVAPKARNASRSTSPATRSSPRRARRTR